MTQGVGAVSIIPHLADEKITPLIMELCSLQSVLLFMVLPLFIFLFFHQKPGKRPTSAGLRTYPLLGNLPQFIKNRHRFLEWSTQVIARTPTHTMGFQIPGQVHWLITANPLNVEHVLKTNFENYPKGERTIALLEDLLGHGIFNADGEHWKWQRKAASFEFSKRSLRSFVVDAIQYEIAHRLLPRLEKASEEGETVDLQDVLERFAFDNICKVVFNEDPACLAADGAPTNKASSDFMREFGEAQSLVVGRFMDALKHSWRVKKLLDVGSERRLREAISVTHDYATRLIRSRKEKPTEHGSHDLLSRFAANPESDDEFLRDIVVSFIAAGRETTSSALTWFFWVLSTRPDVEERILEEIRAVRALHRDSGETTPTPPPPSFEELREMHYLHAALTESMRLYPPVSIDTLTCRADDTLPDGTFVGGGWFVTYSQYAMGRMEEIWGKDCREYRPERWLMESGVFKPESPFRYPVFHAGPRMCLGKEMAYIQMKSISACVLERFRIRCMGKEGATDPEHVLSTTLRMKGGLPIQVKNREVQ